MGKSQVTLPWPPSVNHIWRRGKSSTYKLAKYTAWCKEAAAEIYTQAVRPVRGPYRIHYLLTPPDARKRDQDNFVKAVSDALVRHRVVEDDHLARVTTIAWAEPKKPGSVTVSITAED